MGFLDWEGDNLITDFGEGTTVVIGSGVDNELITLQEGEVFDTCHEKAL